MVTFDRIDKHGSQDDQKQLILFLYRWRDNLNILGSSKAFNWEPCNYAHYALPGGNRFPLSRTPFNCQEIKPFLMQGCSFHEFARLKSIFQNDETQFFLPEFWMFRILTSRRSKNTSSTSSMDKNVKKVFKLFPNDLHFFQLCWKILYVKFLYSWKIYQYDVGTY